MFVSWVLLGHAVLHCLGQETVTPTGISPQSPLAITEVNFHPYPVTEAESGIEDEDQFEFIELLNRSDQTISLNGVRFSTGILFSFTGSRVTSLAAGARVLVVRDEAAFALRYGPGHPVAGPYQDGGLSNTEDLLTLIDSQDRPLVEFTYKVGGNWPSRTDGLGSSLQLKGTDRDPDDGDSWRSSIEYGGTPGAAGLQGLDSIVINEVLSHTDLPLEDAIELFNPTPQPINIGGWYLTDDTLVPKKYRIPNDTHIEAGGYHVVYELAFNYENPDIPFALSSVKGEEVRLFAAENNQVTLFVDNVSFASGENGVSFGRYPNGTGVLVPMSALSLGTDVTADDPADRITEFRTGTGAPNAYPLVGPLVISQIMYHPPDGKSEFIEVQNILDTRLALYDPLAPTNSWSIANAIDYTFPSGFRLEAGEKVVIAGADPLTGLFDEAAFRASYDLPESLRVLGPFDKQLDNDGETIELYKPDPPQTTPPDIGFVPQILVEKVVYDNQSPWPENASGTGNAIHRINATQFGNDPDNWTDQLLPAAPPVFENIETQENGEVSLTFSGDQGVELLLEESGDLSVWNTVTTLTATGDSQAYTLMPQQADRSFFRLSNLP